jgi:hypothetical protein
MKSLNVRTPGKKTVPKGTNIHYVQSSSNIIQTLRVGIVLLKTKNNVEITIIKNTSCKSLAFVHHNANG